MDDPMRQLLAFQKTVLDNSLQAMTDLQDHVVSQVTACIDMNPLLPPEGKRLVSEWLQSYRQGCEALRKSVDANYEKAETFFGPRRG